MNPFKSVSNTHVYFSVKINGKIREISNNYVAASHVPFEIAKVLVSDSIDANVFSSCEIRISINPITDDKELDAINESVSQTMAEEGIEIGSADDDHPDYPGITYVELAEWSKIPLVRQVAMYGTKWSSLSPIDWLQVAQQFYDRYGQTKFYQVHEHKMPQSIIKR